MGADCTPSTATSHSAATLSPPTPPTRKGVGCFWSTALPLFSAIAVGITVAAGNTATLEATLWGMGPWANGTDWGGVGTVITGTHNYWGDPAFVDPDVGDYHIGPGSAAIDVGVDAGTRLDMDNQPRPYQGYDVGADEYWPPGALKHIYLPLVMRNMLRSARREDGLCEG